MLVKNHNYYQKLVNKMLSQPALAKRGSLLNVVEETLARKKQILKIAKTHPTPFYLFDQNALDKNIKSFIAPFKATVPGFKAYYAVKSNPYKGILKTALKHGLGLDVSSAREMDLALKQGAKDLIYSGPGKTDADLSKALKNNERIIIQVDSFGELNRLAKLSKQKQTKIRAGVRIFTCFHGPWVKFGIDLQDLSKFWQQAQKYPLIQLQGIQCHMSYNESAKPFENVIKEIATYLKREFKAAWLKQIKFIDLGGGFWPHLADGVYPWDLPQGEMFKLAAEYFDQPLEFKDKYFLSEAATPEQYAKGISQAISRHFVPLLNCQYFIEPGRVISNRAMHFVFGVVDVKAKNKVILDGGINMAGWDSYLYNYFPVINLTHPSLKEKGVNLYGSLCTPDDIFGYYCYAEKFNEGDILIMPNQGAYTYTWAQEFIKPIPPVVILK